MESELFQFTLPVPIKDFAWEEIAWSVTPAAEIPLPFAWMSEDEITEALLKLNPAMTPMLARLTAISYVSTRAPTQVTLPDGQVHTTIAVPTRWEMPTAVAAAQPPPGA